MPARDLARMNYDEVAASYDDQPYRSKPADANLLAFLAENPALNAASLRILDAGCGTGNQQIANSAQLPEASLIGLDLFGGMVKQARTKAPGIGWVQGDGTAPPFATNTFDYISNQLSYHHVKNKLALFGGIFRVLRSGGWFVLHNLCPEAMDDWLVYRYFPRAYQTDLADFLTNDHLTGLLTEIGFSILDLRLEHIHEPQDLRHFAATFHSKSICSQLTALPQTDYDAGQRQLVTEIRRAGDAPLPVTNHVCLLTLIAQKPASQS